ncbi:MAG: rRNA maturation RNase YbeY [Chthoniobacterales bacterium]|nr:rRNA maturation RNase YbeY [Chthoniobacterales bacterium]
MKTVSLPPISIFNRQRKVPLARAELEDFARRALLLCARERGAGLTSLAQVDVVLISDRKMSELHRRFLQVEGPTDVITFQHGEIFMSVETAQRQARAERTSLLYELRLYLVHGLLHLQGFDDRVIKERRHMAALQERIVAALPVPRPS